MDVALNFITLKHPRQGQVRLGFSAFGDYAKIEAGCDADDGDVAAIGGQAAILLDWAVF